MTATSEARALPFFTDLYGQPLESGFIYIGQPGLDPLAYPVTVNSDAAGSVVVAQPIRTTHGHAAAAGALIHLFVPIPYSITILDGAGRLVYTSLNETDPVAIALGTSSVQSANDLAALRARDKNSTNQVWVTNFGMYHYVPTDTTSPESIPTLIVGSDGGRYHLDDTYVQTYGFDETSNRAASTAWVKGVTTSIRNSINRISALSTAYSVLATDGGMRFELTGTSFTVTLPSAITVGNGWVAAFVRTGSGTYPIATVGGQSINDVNGSGLGSVALSNSFSRITLRSDGSNWIAEDSMFNRAVQNGTGTGQVSTNNVKIGWNGTDSLLCDVDATPQGGILTSVIVTGTGIGSLRLQASSPTPGTWTNLGTVSGSSLWVRVS